MSMRATGVYLAAFSFLLGMAASVSAAPPNKGPLVLKEQGNFYAGGTIELRTPNTTNAALPGDGVAAGHIAVNQANVQTKFRWPRSTNIPSCLCTAVAIPRISSCQLPTGARGGLP